MKPHIAQDITLKTGPTIKNRFLKSAMSEQLWDRAHNPTDKLARLYATWAAGGIGLIVTGNVMVNRRGPG